MPGHIVHASRPVNLEVDIAYAFAPGAGHVVACALAPMVQLAQFPVVPGTPVAVWYAGSEGAALV